MRKEYIDLINKIKAKNKPFEDGLNDNARLLLNSILSNSNDDINIDEYRKKILFRKEYEKEDTTIGIVCVERNIINPIDLNLKNIEVKTTLKYDSYIIIIDKEDNVIDNLMLERFENKEDAIKYAEKLTNIVEENDFVNLTKILANSLEK